MGWLRAIKETKNPQANELSKLKEELCRVSEKLESREHELGEALEQQTATSEILRVIARPPTDIQPVLDAVVESGVARRKDMGGVRAGPRQHVLVHSAGIRSETLTLTLALKGEGSRR